MSSQHTPGRTVDDCAKRLIDLRRLARLERKEFGSASVRTQRLIVEAIAQTEVVVAIEDIAKATRSAQ